MHGSAVCAMHPGAKVRGFVVARVADSLHLQAKRLLAARRFLSVHTMRRI